jgi:polar amino acid transport system ATP-binding protein
VSEILRIERLRKAFGEKEVLRGIDLAVRPGELVFVIGPSGSGKSTLLRCCNRLEEPTGGTIEFEGRDILGADVDVNDLRRHIGMVFQSFNLYPHLTALDNVTLALRRAAGRSRGEAEELGRRALDRVGLLDRTAAFPGELLMDEPTSALDPELVGSVLEVIRELRRSGMTMLVASHEMQFARDAADRVVFVDEGQILERGTPEQIFSQPRHERTRAFLGRILGAAPNA